MRRSSILSLSFGLSLAVLSLAAGCSDKKKSAEEEPKSAACESNADCGQGEVCLAKECAKAAPGAIYTDPQNAVTPDKVKEHMEMINKAAEERMEKALEGAE
jgi:hypothetical protein